MYINHRPVYDAEEEEIVKAFEDLLVNNANPEKTSSPGKSVPTPDKSKKGKTYATSKLLQLLQQYGEVMSDDEISKAFASLLEDHAGADAAFPESMTAHDFIRMVLGFDKEEVVVNGGADDLVKSVAV